MLGVRLLLNPDLNEDVVVRPDGHMSTTVVRDELARGRTVPELTTALTRDYTSILRNPRLNVVLRTFSPTRIYVGGEVAKPGESVTAGLNSHAVAGDRARWRPEERRQGQGVHHPPRTRRCAAVVLGPPSGCDGGA